MGRQIGVAMAEKDEDEFLEFLLASGDIQLLLPFSDTESGLMVERFPGRNRKEESIKILIWNNEFGLKPEVKKSENGKYYVASSSKYPLLEYTSHRFCHKLDFHSCSEPGRLYWAGTKAQSNSYDEKRFEKWYRKIVHWVKSRGIERKVSGYYYMPNTSKWYK